MGYKDQVKSAIGLDSLPGFMLLKSDAATHRSELASWDDGKHTIIRILPEIVDGKIMPARLSNEDNDFSNWICAENMVRKFGVNETFTCFTKAKDAPDDPSPIEVFCRAVHKAVKNKDRSIPREWEDLCQGSANKSPALPKAGKCGLVQCVVIERKGKPIVDEKTKRVVAAYPCVFVFTSGARWNFELLVNERTPDGNFILGDFLSDGAKFKIEKIPYDARTKAMAHYGVSVVVDASGSLEQYPVPDEVLATWRPWSELLRFLTVEEQVKLLCRAFPPDIIDFAIGRTGFAQYLPESVLGAWHRRSANTGPLLAPVPAAEVAAPPVQPAWVPRTQTHELGAMAQVVRGALSQAPQSHFVKVTDLPPEEAEGDDQVPFDDTEVDCPPITAQPGKVLGTIQGKFVPAAQPQTNRAPMQSFDPAQSAISKNLIRERLNAARGGNKPQ